MIRALILRDKKYLASHREDINLPVIPNGIPGMLYNYKTPLEFTLDRIAAGENSRDYRLLKLLIDNGVDLERPLHTVRTIGLNSLSWAYKFRVEPLIELLITYGNVNPYVEIIPESLRNLVDKSFWNRVKEIWLPIGICLRHISTEEQLCILEELIPGVEYVPRFKKSLLITTIKDFKPSTKPKIFSFNRIIRLFRCHSR